jgi:NDP-sugar pyrophosphorylase family protein
MCTIDTLFDLSKTLAKAYLAGFTYPWEALAGIGDCIISLGAQLESDPGYRQIAEQVWVHETAKVAASASVTGPSIIGPEAEVRHCAYIRGNALVGAGCVVGNSVELKNVILFDKVQVPHFNYVGDSILGYKAHMGAGAVTSNVRSDKANVVIHAGENIPTGRKKVGAFLGDNAEIGCNSVLNPGTVVGRNASVYPTSCVRGVVPEGHIYKNDGTVIRRIG